MVGLLSWNYLGLGTSAKRRAAHILVKKHRIDVLCLLETKVTTVDESIINAVWGRYNRSLEFITAEGLLGGIIVVWRTDSFCANFFIRSCDGVLSMKGNICEGKKDCLVPAVYAYTNPAPRNNLWHQIEIDLGSSTLPWCLIGDFNEVLVPEERINAGRSLSTSSTGMRALSRFVETCNLIEFPLHGQKFIWSNSTCMSRIDRAFANPHWFSIFPSINLSGFCHGLSDHCPILLSCAETNWGPRPFRVLDCWWYSPNFFKLVTDFWQASSLRSPAITSALKDLKNKLRHWNSTSFGNVEEKVLEIESQIDKLESLKEARLLADPEVSQAKSFCEQLVKFHRMQECLWQKKSRVQWCNLGDKNTKFFYLSTVVRGSRNPLSSLLLEDRVVSQPDDIKKEVKAYFKSL
ncbi:hypothetical protein CDL15_Pgr005184 [Punica granatum]|uniref:Endonuclease/exonuclease/phosphatase domain-containing protein n=1 Tax=Punica granatum TaxID=22663 RepID=A0A218WP50_PUNGR|nr:hypothetical protein CDL15_Pgr005184 [Punica granatum]